MSARPREHVLADEGRRHFEMQLGPWVYHRLDYHGQDYGVDGQVEVFENGQTTGYKFEVQIKGTDKADLRSALNLPWSQGTRCTTTR